MGEKQYTADMKSNVLSLILYMWKEGGKQGRDISSQKFSKFFSVRFNKIFFFIWKTFFLNIEKKTLILTPSYEKSQVMK